ncbi:DNA-binding protein [Paramuribaculum intestinale]|jgi:hypothetical protein|uniref:DNA-binding protein n=4 Tax=Bacteroidales TaxID=171549 RepID=A0A2V1IPA7_9BACT|nr:MULTISPECIES: helix-turn-helix domain-containing protein [Bacteroidales]ROS90193.1 DNA-binding protein [Muribaculaceae bacterium Isolate-043 (Harlan)]ROT11931.1 DNA-binding protein [Muribaculaceae bacterium Isolate-102 (HZI)]RXE64585.1 DNA-binding protein [Muribaculaceae bacterium Isolate-001 (NCI)]RXE72735.1 DNA-binding protein [Muribaculaceae bacterium Isolate-013 (NCI)]THG41189.1 helix-turn-helix domain-containing protein [Muribaculaceae bacterium]
MDIYSMIEAGGRMKFEVTGEDLCKFAEVLIEKAQEMKAREIAQIPTEEKWLTKKEAAAMCMVSNTTLWAWSKSGYLVPAKMGRRTLYALSDIQKILATRGDDCEAPSWGKGKRRDG